MTRFRLPSTNPSTANEKAWLALLRDLTEDTDPPVTLRLVQHLREALDSSKISS